jgi:uncharacterized membrane protein YeaQ/YmgE (transglycosylase-associated protein family)
MSIASVVGWVVCGLVVGLLARVFLPGGRNVSLLFTMLIGIGGAFLGGLLYWLIAGAAAVAWPGWILAVVGAMIILRLYGGLYPKRWWQ